MNGLIRVVHIITQLELGGAQVNTLYTVEHLDPSHFRTFLVSGPGGMLEPTQGKREDWIIARKLGRSIRPLRDIMAFFELRRIIKRLKPQVVHTHSSKAGILGRLAARSLRVPVIIHSVHGFSFSPLQPFLQRTFFTWAERLIAPLTNHFVFVAESDFTTAKARKLVKDNGTLIRSGFPLDRFSCKSASTETIRQEYGIAADAVVCGVIAPFKPQKGLFHLIAVAFRAVAENPRLVFFLAGDGALRPRLESALRQRGIENRFRLPGFIREIERVMDIFDIGVSTALWEGLPQSLVQMRLKKIPVVASDIPGNREVVREGENGFLVDFRDHERFAGKILLLAADEALRKKLGECDAEDFSAWDADFMVKKQEELYLRLSSEKKRILQKNK